MVKTAKLVLHNLTSIYRVRNFESDVPYEEQRDSTKHENVTFQHNFQNQYATFEADHLTNTPMMPTPTFDFFSTNHDTLNMEEELGTKLNT